MCPSGQRLILSCFFLKIMGSLASRAEGLDAPRQSSNRPLECQPIGAAATSVTG